MATKQQERNALSQIHKIVSELGEDSYLGTAFEGCFDLAEQNIEYDAAFSMKYYETRCAEVEADNKRLLELIEKEQGRSAKLLEQLEKEQEWQPHESELNVKQADYVSLAIAGGTRTLPDDEAEELITKELGFDRSKVIILHSVHKEEISHRCHQIRRIGEIDRPPLYNATDWNYVRFDCAGWYYEMHNGSLRPFYC